MKTDALIREKENRPNSESENMIQAIELDGLLEYLCTKRTHAIGGRAYDGFDDADQIFDWLANHIILFPINNSHESIKEHAIRHIKQLTRLLGSAGSDISAPQWKKYKAYYENVVKEEEAKENNAKNMQIM